MKSGASPQLLKPRRAQRQQAGRAEARVVARRRRRRSAATSVSPKLGAISYASRIVLPASGPNSRNTVVSCTKVDAQRQEGAVLEQLPPELLLLVFLRVRLQRGSLNYSLILQHAADSSTRR